MKSRFPYASQNRLVEDAVAGDRSALERLLLSNHRRLAALIAKKRPSSLSATIAVDDVLQETFAEAFRRIGSLQPQGDAAFCHWLTTIAEHRLADMIKAQLAAKRGGGRRAPQGQADPKATSVFNLLDAAAGDNPTPSRSVARHEAVSAVQVALAGLDEDYRWALQLRYIKGLPVDEIARKMGRTKRAVHMLCNRGLKQLRAALGRSSQYLTKKS